AVAARRDRSRGVLEREIPRTHHVSRIHRIVQGVRGRPWAVHALPPGRARRPRGEHRLHPRHDRRARLRRLEIQPRHPGDPPARPYPSIHIGAKGVKPMEMIAAYTAFATLGTRSEPIGILRVEDRQGNILWKSEPRRDEVMDPEHTWLMVDMMKDVIRRGTAF